MKCRGSMTVAMCLFLSAVIVLFSAGLKMARMQSARVAAVNGADAGLYSLFAEYDKDLLEEYGLFFLDIGYGTEQLNALKMVKKMEESIKPVAENPLTSCQLQSCGITGFCMATDESGTAFSRQVERVMKKQLGTDVLQNINEKLAGEERVIKQQEAQKARGPMEIPDEVLPENVQMPEFTAENNPISLLKKVGETGILGLVIPDKLLLSEKEADISRFVSRRPLQQGLGRTDSREKSSLAKLCMQEFICEKLNSFVDKKDNAVLCYQAEYAVGGTGSDKENLKKTVNRLLLLREAVNAAYLYTDQEKCVQAKAAGAVISSLLFLPEAAEAVSQGLILGWAYAESLLDVRQLLLGGKVPAVKSADTWRLELTDFGTLFEMLQSNSVDSSSGLSYEDYLKLILFTVSQEKLTFRCMDMVEQNIRQKAGRESFRLDNCLESLSVDILFSGPDRKELTASRSYGYDMK